jgi:hypothetical protein
MGDLWRDVGYSLRMLKKNPGFSAIAILVLALGIGANTAIFGLVNACFLRPIMAKNPSELVACYNWNTAPPYDFRLVSYLNYRDLRENNHAFSGLLAHTLTMVGLTEGDMTRTASADIISSNYFDVFGVSLFKGRAFRPEEEVPDSGVPVVIVSYGFWKKHGEDPNLVGKTLRINGHLVTIVGIAPQGFTGRLVLISRELYLPIGMYHLRRATAHIETQDRQSLVVGQHELLLRQNRSKHLQHVWRASAVSGSGRNLWSQSLLRCPADEGNWNTDGAWSYAAGYSWADSAGGISLDLHWSRRGTGSCDWDIADAQQHDLWCGCSRPACLYDRLPRTRICRASRQLHPGKKSFQSQSDCGTALRIKAGTFTSFFFI